VGGRCGGWYAYASADVNQAFAVSVPPTGWVNRSCAAWSTGGPVSGVQTNNSYAGIGASLLNGSPYDLSIYTGVIVQVESGQQVVFDVRDTNGAAFGYTLAGGGSGAVSYTIPFSSLVAETWSQASTINLRQATDLQFASLTPRAYGFAVHSIVFY
jgi:hypothetical protein